MLFGSAKDILDYCRICVAFLSFSVLVSKNLKNGPSERWNFFFEQVINMGYKKFKNFRLMYKKANLSHFFSFLILTFALCHIVNLYFLNQYKIFNLLISNMTYFKGKKFSPLKRAIFKNFQHKNQKIETPQIKEKCFLRQSYLSLANPKIHEA